jgi:purine nucleosidase
MPKHRIIIDCDPGVDDAIAILLAFGSSPDLEVAGITTAAGNVPLPATTRNALRICHLAGRSDIPVFQGCDRPLLPTPPRSASVHGADGLGDIDLASADFGPSPGHAVDFIIDTIRRSPGEITLCPIGPMTNIAVALQKAPDLAAKIKEIVFMGGAAFCPGNSTPQAEFNIWFDPHAAQMVLASGVKLTMFGLDVTEKALITQERLAALRSRPNRAAKKAADMLEQYGRGDSGLHDPCVVAYLIDETLFSGVDAKVDVDCTSPLSRGKTIAAVTERHRNRAAHTCKVITEIDDSRFFALLGERLARCQA